MKIIRFEIPGKIKGKARPRMSNAGGVYTPGETVSYENWVKSCFLYSGSVNKNEVNLKPNIPISMKIKCYFEIPKSYSKKKKEMCKNFLMFPTKKPDSDNIAKIICDSLNKIAYDDDKQIIDIHITKAFSENERVEIEMQYLDFAKTI